MSGGSGGGAPGGGYNPQPMQGAPYSPGPPGWDMRLGSGGVPYMQAAQGRYISSTPDWLKLQLGQYEDQPWATNPNQYGRWNWGTNMQGQGIPSPFGQYAQQFATYPSLQFPPMPGQGGGPGQPPPPGGGQPPAPPPQPPSTPPNPTNFSGLSQQQQYLLAKQMGWDSPLNQQLLQQAGSTDAYNQLVNKYNANGTGSSQDAAYAQQLAIALNPNTSAAARAYNANLLQGTPWAQYLK